jgi:hypothetical protein
MDRGPGPPRQAILSLVNTKECCGPAHYALMSALGQKRTLRLVGLMSALPPKADIS